MSDSDITSTCSHSTTRYAFNSNQYLYIDSTADNTSDNEDMPMNNESKDSYVSSDESNSTVSSSNIEGNDLLKDRFPKWT